MKTKLRFVVILLFLAGSFHGIAQTAQSCTECTTSSPLNSGLIFCAPMTGNANDVTSYPVTPTLSGPGLTTDRFGTANSAYDFLGSQTAKITYSASTKLNSSSTQSISFSAWFYQRDTTYNPNFVTALIGNNNSAYSIYIGGTAHGVNSRKLIFEDYYGPTTSSVGTVVSPNKIPLNTWNHVAVTIDKTTGLNTLYLNGVQVATATITNSVLTTPLVSVGNNFVNSWGMMGKVDDVRIYNRVLSSTEVTSLYNLTDPQIAYTPITDKEICVGDSVQLTATGGTSYSWNPATGLSNPNVANPYAKPGTTQVYAVTITKGLCTMTDTVVVNVNANCCVTCNSSSSLNSGLIACYPFNGNANDASGNGNNGTVSSNALLTTNRNGTANKAYNFDGTTSSRIDVPAATMLNTATLTSFTYACWFNAAVFSPSPQTAYRRIFCVQDASFKNYDLAYMYPYNKLNFINFNGTGDNINLTSNTVFSPNTWYHVAIVIGTDNKVKLYVNGVLDNSSTITVLKPSNPTYTIGNHTVNPWNFAGKIDDIRIYNRALTAAELTQLAGLKDALSTPTLINKTICMGDSVQLVSGGGTSYSWSPSTGLSNPSIANPYAKPADTTKYYVTVSNGICQVTDTVKVNVNRINPVVGVTQRVCIGGDSAQLTVSGGTSYRWYPGKGMKDSTIANPKVKTTQTTVYYVNITNGVCKAVDSMKVIVDTIPSVKAGPDLNMCFGDSIQLSAMGADSYTWSPGQYLSSSVVFNPFAKPTNTIDYIVEGKRGACAAKDTIRITVCQCNTATRYDTVIVTVTHHLYDTVTINHHVYDTVTVTNHQYDTITVHQIVFDSIHITVMDTLIIDLFTGINPPAAPLTTIKVFPNPAHDHLFITVNDFAQIPNHRIKIINILGQTKYDQPLNQQTQDIDINTLGGAGTYFLQILDGNGQTVDTRKVIVR
jgi:hypothetical protein